MSSKIQSKMITGVSASEITNRRLTNKTGLQPGQKLAYMVMKVKLDHKTYYCCLSGGELKDGAAHFTEIGKAALETLLALPVGNDDELVMQEVKLGVTPLDQKVKQTLRKLPSGSKICFFGDMAGALDGVLFDVFNVSGTTEV
jgi:hypothetical protein